MLNLIMCLCIRRLWLGWLFYSICTVRKICLSFLSKVKDLPKDFLKVVWHLRLTFWQGVLYFLSVSLYGCLIGYSSPVSITCSPTYVRPKLLFALENTFWYEISQPSFRAALEFCLVKRSHTTLLNVREWWHLTYVCLG